MDFKALKDSLDCKELKDFLESGTIKNSVNFPDCELLPSANTRIINAHANVPNMVGQITTILAENKINIADMVTHHRDKIGYNIIDIEGTISDDVVEKMRKIDGVKMVRVI